MEWSSDGDYSVYTGTVVANSSAKIASRLMELTSAEIGELA
jgi:hypothetical protein